ncbi:hypothetical protein [Ferrovibrio sp.]|uniref:hypothetical protein n=1 Tax=Ferrovibrio sp. TaxID=1917215 RepID=UPI001B7A9A48|nr:hypothetical protein [Ferrovibrio sp.]MBP7064703.1 hypothetical protein [Ferrovibrio sp.]
MMMKPPFMLLAMLALAACTPGTATEWARPDTTLEQQAKDEADCARIGDQKAFDASFRPRVYGMGANLRVESPSYSERSSDMYFYTNECMLQRGYRLVPVTPKS